MKMKEYDAIVIGGSAAGITAAITTKRLFPDKRILLIRKEPTVVIPCGIPYIFGTLNRADKNLIPNAILSKNEIDLKVDEVTEIDRNNNTVMTSNRERVGYQRLVLATGSFPAVPPIPGADKENIFTIEKNLSYLEQVIDAMEEASDLVIVGCGFIGCEIAEECRKRREDLNITIVEMLEHCLQLVYDEDFCIKAEKILKEKNIDLLLDEKVEAFQGERQVEKVMLKSGKDIKADIVIISIGARANSEIAKKADLEIGSTNGIKVNRYMQTSDENIFACGDCTEKVSFFDGKPTNLKLASIATMEARIAGANLYSLNRVNMGVIGVYSTILGDTTFAAAGMTKTIVKEKGFATIVGESESINRHPGCMPGADPLKVTLIFDKGSRILLGGQITGARSGGELINTVSACIHKKMTADDIATFQTGTHPALTASPIVYPLVNAAEIAIKNMQSS
jgi:NADPH-dependent 2,4-dienoyl-CoA reductase/sulfur reductase-like enzyme